MRPTPSTLLLATFSSIVLGVSPALTSCGGEPEKAAGSDEPVDEHAGHDHGPGEEHDHDHDAEEKGTPLGSFTAAGTKISVELHGEITAGEEAHVDLKAMSGPDPEAVRGWIGVESGAGSMKGKAEATSGGYHLHAEAPAEITPEMKLWIEVQSADGTRETKAVPLKAN